MTVRQRRIHRSQLSLAHLAAVVIVALSVLLVVDFGLKAADLFRVSQEARVLEQEMNRQLGIRQQLQKRLDYVQSDAYVEEAARKLLRWSRPGETVVMVMSPPAAATTTRDTIQPASREDATPRSSWLRWWFLFFGNDSPPPTIF
jgi:cell division protein FtsB